MNLFQSETSEDKQYSDESFFDEHNYQLRIQPCR